MEFKERVGMIKDQPEEYQRGYYDGYHTGYSDVRSKVTAARNEERKRYDNALQNMECSSLYPFNLLEDVLDLKNSDEKQMFSLDSLNTVINAHLTERERRVIEMRYRDRMTLQEVGDVFSFGRERARQIEAKAVRKLKYWLPEAEVVLAVDYKALQRDYERLKAENKYWEAKYNSETEIPEHLTAPDIVKEGKHYIDSVDLSIRSYNCLRRAGIECLEELQNKPYEEMISIRNLGRRSILEIRQKMIEYGLQPPIVPLDIINKAKGTQA